MLIELDKLREDYSLDIREILHVGAHEAEELDVYRGVETWWVEADRDKWRGLVKRFAKDARNHAVLAVVGEHTGDHVTFNIANNGQSSSILPFGTHSKEHPEVKFVTNETRTTQSLSDVCTELGIQANFLNLDIQGAELLALKGLGDYLDYVDYIYTEVNRKELYKGCALDHEITAFLADHGFLCVETEWTPHGWGDSFYIREALVDEL